MKPEPDKIIVRCLDCNEEWDMDSDPAVCTDTEHAHSLNGTDPVDGHGNPVER